MPKKLNLSSNERVDLVDFNRAAAEYTQESDNFSRKQLILARRSLVASGFRIELADQTANPGQFTLYNGLGIDRDGNLLNNEDQLNDARTITLSGATTNFYIEVEFVESESDVDGRAFWDPTFSGNTPPGREFTLSVATRLSPDWQINTPVNTSDFDATVNVNSTKIPIAVLTTDGSNEITGSTLVNISTVLEEDAASSDTIFKVVDSTLFPTNGTALLGAEAVTITGNDRTNGLITISPGLTGSFLAGTFFVQTDAGTDNWVPEDPAGVPTTAEDRRRGLFKGDETRGSALSASPVTAGDRSDLLVRNLKDHVDFLAAQLHELKWGSQRPGASSTIPPLAFTDTRYFDNAGSLQGSKESLITIGDGTYTYGDLNSTSDDLGTILQQAHDALDATNGGSIYVKAGDYVFNATLITNRPLRVEFDAGVNFVAGTYTGIAFQVSSVDLLEVVGMPPSPAGESLNVGDYTGLDANIILRDGTFGSFVMGSSTSGTKALAENCVFINLFASGDTLSQSSAARDEISVYRNCKFLYGRTTGDSTRQLVLNAGDSLFEDCTFDISYNTGGFSVDSFINQSMGGSTSHYRNSTFTRCKFVSTDTGKAVNPFDFRSTTFYPGHDNITFRDCTFDFTFGTTTSAIERTVLDFAIPTTGTGNMKNILIENCDFSAIDENNTITGTTEVAPYRAISFVSADPVYNVVVNNCKFGKEVDPAGATSTIPNHYTEFVFLGITAVEGSGVTISDNTFSSYTKAINVEDARGFSIVGNYFRSKMQTAPFGSSIKTIHVQGQEGEGLIANNRIKMLTFETGASSSIAGIYVEDCRNLTIADNNISVSDFYTAGTTYVYGIFASTFTDPTQLIITGNKIESLSAQKGCIGVSLDINAGTYSSVVVSNNAFNLGGLSAVLYDGALAIDVDVEQSVTSSSPTVVSGNVIRIQDGNGVEMTSTVRGIRVRGNQVSVTGNSVHMDEPGATNVVGILLDDAEYCSVTGNHISITDSTASLYGIKGIFLDDDCSYNTVSGNTIYGEADMRWCIQVGGGDTFSEMRAITVTNNTMEESCTDTSNPHGGIYFVTTNTTVGECGAWVISGNSFFNRVVGAGTAALYAIYVYGTLQVDGVSIDGNSSAQASLPTIRLSDIFVADVKRVNITNNTCTMIASSSGSIRIQVLNCDDVLILGNNIPYSGGIGAAAPVLQISNCTAGVYDNNIGAGATNVTAVLLSGNSNINSGGSNLWTTLA